MKKLLFFSVFFIVCGTQAMTARYKITDDARYRTSYGDKIAVSSGGRQVFVLNSRGEKLMEYTIKADIISCARIVGLEWTEPGWADMGILRINCHKDSKPYSEEVDLADYITPDLADSCTPFGDYTAIAIGNKVKITKHYQSGGTRSTVVILPYNALVLGLNWREYGNHLEIACRDRASSKTYVRNCNPFEMFKKLDGGVY
jgi:hypothetical protein